MRAATIARVELVRFLRDRSNIFFVFVFPLLLIALIGAQFGGGADLRLGVVAPDDDPHVVALLEAIDAAEGLRVTRVADAATLEADVVRGLVTGGLVVEEGYGAAIEAVEPVELAFVGRPDGTGTALSTLVSGVVAEQVAAGRAAQLAGAHLGTDPVPLREVAASLADQTPPLAIETTTVGVDQLAREFAGLGRFDLGASSQLWLFTFLTSLAGSAALIQIRQLGIATRVLSTPTSLASMVLGLAGGRFAIALLQALYIVVATTLVFGVSWGDPLGAAVVIVLFTAVSAGAGMLVGATFRNDSQASGIGVGLGIGLAALGGAMVPIELFPDAMRTVARVTPHAWAGEAMAELVRRGGTLLDVLPQVGALAAFAVVLLGVGGWQLRRSIVH